MESIIGAEAQLPPTKAPRQKKPNYHIIHATPLPLRVVPLPPLIPHNPLSLLYILYTYLFPSPSTYAQPSPLYTATFSSLTCAVEVTDPASIRGLWCSGFFGKGSLSRSEPTWLTRTQRRLGIIGKHDNLTAEELTERRRNERREFKKERARLEKEKLERILEQEGKLVSDKVDCDNRSVQIVNEMESPVPGSCIQIHNDAAQPTKEMEYLPSTNSKRPVVSVEDLEHLQLTLEEAFFLSFALGVLKITGPSKNNKHLSSIELLELFRMHSYTPSKTVQALQPDDPFMVNYVVYHHYRSLGWVVKPGVKFAVDYCKLSQLTSPSVFFFFSS